MRVAKQFTIPVISAKSCRVDDRCANLDPCQRERYGIDPDFFRKQGITFTYRPGGPERRAIRWPDGHFPCQLADESSCENRLALTGE